MNANLKNLNLNLKLKLKKLNNIELISQKEKVYKSFYKGGKYEETKHPKKSI